MGYPCIYQEFPRPFHDTITSPRLSHKNQMIWSLSLERNFVKKYNVRYSSKYKNIYIFKLFKYALNSYII